MAISTISEFKNEISAIWDSHDGEPDWNTVHGVYSSQITMWGIEGFTASEVVDRLCEELGISYIVEIDEIDESAESDYPDNDLAVALLEGPDISG